MRSAMAAAVMATGSLRCGTWRVYLAVGGMPSVVGPPVVIPWTAGLTSLTLEQDRVCVYQGGCRAGDRLMKCAKWVLAAIALLLGSEGRVEAQPAPKPSAEGGLNEIDPRVGMTIPKDTDPSPRMDRDSFIYGTLAVGFITGVVLLVFGNAFKRDRSPPKSP
jgi:hypothetical protein